MVSNVGISRQRVEYLPSVWGDYFIKHYSTQSPTDSLKRRAEELVGQVKKLLNNDAIYKDHELELLNLIDSLQRLGIGYHFEDEIDDRLKALLIRNDDGKDHGVDDLHAVALKFRLLRQQGYHAASDVFSKYREAEGKFKMDLAEDVRGLLSLYEACFWATHENDSILDESLSFSKHHLQKYMNEAEGIDSALKKLVSHALEIPLQRGIPRSEARFYLSIYEHDIREEEQIDIVLELSKLDYHLVQLLHQEEARSLTLWWEEIFCDGKFSFSRDRIVECYFWLLAVYYEPQYTTERKITTKIVALLSIFDDVFDIYGTYDELHSFTDAIERWDVGAAKQLDNCMEALFDIFDNVFKEFKDDSNTCGESYRMIYLKYCMKKATRAFLQEVKWRDERYIPMLEEHLGVTAVSTCTAMLSCAFFMGMGDVASKEVYDWVSTFPNFINHASRIFRLKDDIASQEFEQKRDHVASVVQCYMKEHNCTMDEAHEELLKMVEYEWKSMNQEYLKLSSVFSRHVLMRVFNFARFAQNAYDAKDKYTEAILNDHIKLVLVDPIRF